MFSFYKSVLLAAMAGQASAATSTATQSPYPIPYNWSKFPAGICFTTFFLFFNLFLVLFFPHPGGSYTTVDITCQYHWLWLHPAWDGTFARMLCVNNNILLL